MTECRTLLDEIVSDALIGRRGPDQSRIASEGLAWIATILRKNADYGSSVWHPPVLAPHIEPPTAMLVRMSDKVKRIAQLVSKGTAEVSDESLEDSIRDLGAYCLLYLARPKTQGG